jgi:hypothetical protein
MWTVSSTGRNYLKGKALSSDLRTLIIDKIISKDGDPASGRFDSTYTDIARSVGVSRVVVAKIWKKFCSVHSFSPEKHSGGNPSHLSYGDLCLIEALKREKPSINYDEILEKLYEFGDLPFGNVSKSAISNAVRRRLPSGEFTLKKLGGIAQERFTVQNMAYTQLFLDYLYQKDPYDVKFFDECGLKLPSASRRNYGHAPRGERALEFERYAETPNITVNLMASLAGVCYANTVDGPADTIDFLRFFDEAYNSVHPATNQPCLEPGNIIVMDNCPTHHNEGGRILGEFLQDLNIELVYMPAYSPDLNPVEYVFGKLRTLMKHQFVHVTNENLKESLYTAIECISPGDMAGFYKVTGYMNI